MREAHTVVIRLTYLGVLFHEKHIDSHPPCRPRGREFRGEGELVNDHVNDDFNRDTCASFFWPCARHDVIRTTIKTLFPQP